MMVNLITINKVYKSSNLFWTLTKIGRPFDYVLCIMNSTVCYPTDYTIGTEKFVELYQIWSAFFVSKNFQNISVSVRIHHREK